MVAKSGKLKGQIWVDSLWLQVRKGNAVQTKRQEKKTKTSEIRPSSTEPAETETETQTDRPADKHLRDAMGHFE